MGKFDLLGVEDGYYTVSERFVFFDDADMIIGLQYGYASGNHCAGICIFVDANRRCLVEFYIPLDKVRQAVRELADGEV